MPKRERTIKMSSTTSAVSWSVKGYDDVRISRISLQIDVAPTTVEPITLTIKNEDDVSVSSLIRSIDAVGHTDIVIDDIIGIDGTDNYYLLVEYANTDGRTITGFATMEY
jgi:GTPase